MATTRRALAGAALATATMGLAPTVAAAPAPDAALIAACADYIAAVDAYNADPGSPDPDDDPLWQALLDAEARVLALPPVTIAGALAKARIAQHLARQPGGEDWDSSYTGRWPGDVCQDLLRLSA